MGRGDGRRGVLASAICPLIANFTDKERKQRLRFVSFDHLKRHAVCPYRSVCVHAKSLANEPPLDGQRTHRTDKERERTVSLRQFLGSSTKIQNSLRYEVI